MKIFFKTISLTLGCCIIILLAIASNSRWFNASAKYIPSPYRYGDLYLLSSMPGYKIKNHSKLKPPFSTRNKNTTLTVIGDSYTEHFDSSLFNFYSYHFIHWDKLPDTIPVLDSTKRNILIIESTERYVRWRFKMNNLLSIGKKKQQVREEPALQLAAETNLQYMLTHLDWELPFKELKTSIYLNYFDKFSTMVSKPDGTGRLYLNETIDPQNSSSSFNPVDDVEIKIIVENINKLCEQLSNLCFDEVYVSIIPNAASIYKKSDIPYNHLLERIQQHPGAKFKFINVYEDFKQEKKSVFHCNDSHWNALGQMIWLKKINNLSSD